MDVYEIFNEKLKALINDLVAICPDVPDFTMLRNGVTLGMALDRRMAQQYFAMFVARPYGDQIRARDEAFFLEHNYDDANVETDVVQKIKGVWSSLGAHNKDTIWKYFQLLVVLSDACQSA